MWKYIVTWMIIKTTAIPCPKPELTIDEFGRISSSHIEVAMMCTTSDTIKKSKEFLLRKDAIEFIERGQSQLKSYPGVWPFDDGGNLENFKLDSVIQPLYTDTLGFIRYKKIKS